MSQRSFSLLLVTCLTLISAVGVSSSAAEKQARLATFSDATGDAYFALSLSPAQRETAAPSDVVVLIDTSASQTGIYREDALATLNCLLAQMGADDRVHLLALDLDALALTDEFSAPRSSAAKMAFEKLSRRTPLGSTDLGLGLQTAASMFDGPATRNRVIIYMGDGISRANLLSDAEFSELLSSLVAKRASVSSLAIGPQRNVQLLATLANHTGGQVLIDSDQKSPDQCGLDLARISRASVLWPVEVEFPAMFSEHYPTQLPPLRSDRDSILVGKLKAAAGGELRGAFEVGGVRQKLQWQLAPESSNPDFIFLPRLVKEARESSGLNLPTAGSAGLRETARMMMNSAEQLAEIGSHALRTGNLDAARSAAQAALDRDPSSPHAQALESAVKRLTSPDEAPAPIQQEGELRLFPIQTTQGNGTSLLDEFEGSSGTTLDAVETNRRIQSEMIQAEVEAGLESARSQMAVDPIMSKQSLKVLLEGLRRSTHVDAEVRDQLMDRIQSAIREANRRSVEVENRRAYAEENKAAAVEAERLVERTARDRQRIKQLMDRFGTLLDERKYEVAEDIAMQVEDLDPDSAIARGAVWNARNLRNVNEMERIRDLRHRNFVNALYWVENSAIPFPDEPPIVYPSADVWETLTANRQKYASVDLAGRPGSSEQRISQELNKETSFEYLDQSLRDVVDDISFRHDMPIVIDTRALEDFGIGTDTPITMSLKGITLKSALRLLLSEQDLTYVIQDEVLQITTPEEAEAKLITKVYPVGDLVIPVGLLSGGGGGGGLGGGLGGGGLGGGGGGFGGGGGGGFGGGGRGGFGGGGFGGGGGGFFAVDDEFSLSSQKESEQTPSTDATAATDAQRRDPQAVKLERRAGESSYDAWNRHFAAHRHDAAADRVEHQAQIRQTVRQLQRKAERASENKQPAEANAARTEIATLIQAALRHNQPQPWMYEAMTLSMLAADAPMSEVERALMSAVDFSTHVDEVLHVAAFMTQVGLDQRALKLYQEVAQEEPYRTEPYINGLGAAQQAGDEQGIRWACVGILRQAWPLDEQKIEQKARRVATTLLEKMVKEQRHEDAKQFVAQLNQTLQRDCIVRVTWTGDADVDLLVEEPSATICSLQSPRTTSGGVLLGDVFAHQDEQSIDGFSEIYVCPKGFSGQYRLLLRRVYGEVTAGKVTVEICTNYGTEQQTYGKQQIPLGEKDAIVNFEVEHGRRTESLDEAKVASVARARQEVGRAILAQQFAGVQDGSASRAFALALSRGVRSGAIDPRLIGRRGAVGFRPQITSFPEGNQMFGMAIISADRRYVRFELAAGIPIASGITNVDTFNFVDGGTGGGGGGLGGGGLGGGGGGGFGGGGGGFGGGGFGGGGGF